MIEPLPNFDPHNLKAKGATSAVTTHINEPYDHQEYPKHVEKDGVTYVVKSAEDEGTPIIDSSAVEAVDSPASLESAQRLAEGLTISLAAANDENAALKTQVESLQRRK